MSGPRLVCVACGRKSSSFQHTPFCSTACRDGMPGMPVKPQQTDADRAYLEWRKQRDGEAAA